MRKRDFLMEALAFSRLNCAVDKNANVFYYRDE